MEVASWSSPNMVAMLKSVICTCPIIENKLIKYHHIDWPNWPVALNITLNIHKNTPLYTLGMAARISCIARETASCSPVQLILVYKVNIYSPTCIKEAPKG